MFSSLQIHIDIMCPVLQIQKALLRAMLFKPHSRDESKAQKYEARTLMNSPFGSNARFDIRKSGPDNKLVLNLRASRKAQSRWFMEIWKRIVQYVNGTYPDEKDAANVLQLMSELGWSARALSIRGVERKALESEILKEAREARSRVKEILGWMAKPGKNAEGDSHAVKTISEHNAIVKLEVVNERVVSRFFAADHFLDSISRFVYSSLRQMGENLLCLPEPSPIGICATRDCPLFFVRNGKRLHCIKHRSARGSRSTADNRRYKFIRDNMRLPMESLRKKIAKGRVSNARDGEWKNNCLIRIHTDRTNVKMKRPVDYLHLG